MYGQLAGMVGPIINFPQVLTQAIAMSLVPAVSIAHKQQDIPFMHQNIKMGLRSAIIVGLPCAFGFMVLSRQIMLLLYPLQREGAINAADLLFIMGIGVVFLATVQTLTGVLQGIGKQLIPVRNLAIGAVAKLIISYTLIVTPGVGVRGAAIGTVTAFVIASILNLIAVRKYTGVKIDIKLTFLKPALAGLAMAFCVWATYTVISLVIADALSTLISIVIGAMVYFFMILKIKVVTMDELAKMPKGAKLVKIAHKFKLN
jgi:stage V sporulation protein B